MSDAMPFISLHSEKKFDIVVKEQIECGLALSLLLS